jgi:hypothetical protein
MIQHFLVTISSKIIGKDSARAGIFLLIPTSSTSHKSKGHNTQTLQINTVSQKRAIFYLNLGGVVFISSILQSV